MIKRNIQSHGLIVPEITPDHYVLGGFSKLEGEIINPSGRWTPWVVAKEPQSKNGVETNACATFGTNNCIETLQKFNNVDVNYSDRYIAKVSGTDPLHGNDPQKVAETIRKVSGEIPESELPFGDDIKTVEQYYDIVNLEKYEKDGQRFYNNYDFSHEWVFTGGTPEEKKAQLTLALQKGTVAVSVHAWVYDDGKKWFIKPPGSTDNHWVQLLEIQEDGSYLVFDSYDTFTKVLEPLYDFSIAKVYYLNPAGPKLSLIQSLIDWIKKLIPFFQQEVNQVSIDQTPPAPVQPNTLTPAQPVDKPDSSKYLWDTPKNAEHSVRLICDENNLSWDDKNMVCQVINCESGFNTQAKHENKDKEGNVSSTDWGIVQVNDYWWIGKGKQFPSVLYVLSNPEECVRWMIERFKAGHLEDWVCYKSGEYKKYVV